MCTVKFKVNKISNYYCVVHQFPYNPAHTYMGLGMPSAIQVITWDSPGLYQMSFAGCTNIFGGRFTGEDKQQWWERVWSMFWCKCLCLGVLCYFNNDNTSFLRQYIYRLKRSGDSVLKIIRKILNPYLQGLLILTTAPEYTWRPLISSLNKKSCSITFVWTGLKK